MAFLEAKLPFSERFLTIGVWAVLFFALVVLDYLPVSDREGFRLASIAEAYCGCAAKRNV